MPLDLNKDWLFESQHKWPVIMHEMIKWSFAEGSYGLIDESEASIIQISV